MSNKTKLKIIPLGGLEAIGMNITAFEYEDSIIVVDCGLAFPEDDMYGIDLVIPDITYLLENADKVKGFVFTHGHEDHIGALPYILKQLNVPISIWDSSGWNSSRPTIPYRTQWHSPSILLQEPSYTRETSRSTSRRYSVMPSTCSDSRRSAERESLP